MKLWVRGVVAVALLLATARVGVADCASDDPDGSKVAAARSTADETCTAAGEGCSNAPNHGTYVSCIGHVIPGLVTGGLPKSCVGTVRKCAARSTCGRQVRGFVTCCITTNKSEKLCKVERNAAVCAGRGGCTGSFVSCCDACAPSGGCNPPP
jgi:hypothetical protein